MKNKSNKGVVIVNGKEKWERKEAFAATKLILQKTRQILKNKMLHKRNLDAFGNSDLELAKNSVKKCLIVCWTAFPK